MNNKLYGAGSASPLLSRHRVAVDTRGDLVTVHFGNVEVALPYEVALQLSQWLRVRAKQAKRRAGDSSRHWSIVAQLSDLELDTKKGLV